MPCLESVFFRRSFNLLQVNKTRQLMYEVMKMDPSRNWHPDKRWGFVRCFLITPRDMGMSQSEGSQKQRNGRFEETTHRCSCQIWNIRESTFPIALCFSSMYKQPGSSSLLRWKSWVLSGDESLYINIYKNYTESNNIYILTNDIHQQNLWVVCFLAGNLSTWKNSLEFVRLASCGLHWQKKSSILRLHTWQTRPQSEVSQKTSWPRPGPKHGCLVAMSFVFFLFMACRWGIIRGIISPSNTNKFPQYVGIIMYYDTWIANDLLGFSGGWCQCGCLFGVDEITSLLSLIQFLHRLPGQCLCAPRKKTLWKTNKKNAGKWWGATKKKNIWLYFQIPPPWNWFLYWRIYH